MITTRQDYLKQVIEAITAIRTPFSHDPKFIEHGIGMPHYRLMIKLSRSGKNGQTMHELAEGLSVTTGAVTQFMNKLVDEQLAERIEDANDRRIVWVRLTKLGFNKFHKMQQWHFDHMSYLFQHLTSEDLEHLADIVKKIETKPEGQ